MNEQALHTRLIELEKKNLTELKIELKKGKEELDTIEQWIILDWYTMIEDYLHGADNWKNEIEEHENARCFIRYCKILIEKKGDKNGDSKKN